MEVGGAAATHTHIHKQFSWKPTSTFSGKKLPSLCSDPHIHYCLPFSNTTDSFWVNTHPFLLHYKSKPISSASFQRAPLPITAVIKRFNERPLDKVIQSQKKLKLVTKLKQILLQQPQKKIAVKDLVKYRKHLGFQGRRRILPILRRYPALFHVYEEEPFSKYCRLTPRAEQFHLEELQVKAQIEEVLVRNLQKLLMMSPRKRILLEKIGHIANDMGLPPDFRTNLCKKYPQFFRVVETDYGPALELASWDNALALSVAEQKTQNSDYDLIIDRPRKFKKIDLPKGYSLSRKHKVHILKFQELPFISPYCDCKSFEPASMEKEKHACAVVHELLNLTVEKKTLVDHLTHFRHEFKFPNKLRAMLLHHPEMFYVSFKGQRDTVFLREAYHGSELIDKGPLLQVQERLHSLMLMGNKQVADTANDNAQSEEEYGDDNDDEYFELDGTSEDDYEQTQYAQIEDSDDEWTDPDLDKEEEEVRLVPRPVSTVFEIPTEKKVATLTADGVSRDCW